jgi:hypothetical protein
MKGGVERIVRGWMDPAWAGRYEVAAGRKPSCIK